MSRVKPMGEVRQKEPKEDADPEHLARVASLPCVICYEFGMTQLSPTTVHHCIHGRYSGERRPDSMTIPLCDGHHQARFDNSKIAIHRGKETWKAEYGEDTDFLSWVERRT